MKHYVFSVAMILLILMSGCGVMEKELNAFPYEYMIGLNDLPDDFKYIDSDFLAVEGAKSYTIVYGRTSEEFNTSIRHQIAIYPDPETVLESNSFWQNETFTSAWTTNMESTFKPTDPEDNHYLKCIPLTVNGVENQSCRFLQFHKNLVIYIYFRANSERGMSMEEFDEVLQKLDARLPAENVPVPE